MPPNNNAATTDSVLATLRDTQVHSATFQQLTGSANVRDLSLYGIRKIRERIAREDQSVRAGHKGQDVSCLAWKVAAFWLLDEDVGEYYRAVEQSRSNGNGCSYRPVWQLTLRSMFGQHIANLQQLVLLLAYDWVMIDVMQEELGDGDAWWKEALARYEQVVADLIQDLSNQEEGIRKLLGNNIERFERACITERMMENGEIKEGTLGRVIVLETLRRAKKKAAELCRQESAVFERQLGQNRDNVQEGLRKGERTQLARANRLDLAFRQIGQPPAGYSGMASLAAFERKRLAEFVASRENELGSSEEGEALLKESSTLDKPRLLARVKPKDTSK
ncbi:MAG: hypothetical protein ABIH23_07675 [bacterium]